MIKGNDPNVKMCSTRLTPNPVPKPEPPKRMKTKFCHPASRKGSESSTWGQPQDFEYKNLPTCKEVLQCWAFTAEEMKSSGKNRDFSYDCVAKKVFLFCLTHEYLRL
jgi:hypothetical protein